MVDLIVHRRDMRNTVGQIARMLMKAPAVDMIAKAVEKPAAKEAESAEPVAEQQEQPVAETPAAQE